MRPVHATRMVFLAAAMLIAPGPRGFFADPHGVRIRGDAAAAPAIPTDRSATVSESTTLPQRYKVIFHDQDQTEDAGVVSISADGMIAVISTPPRFVNAIDVVVKNMNTKTEQSVKAPPPPDAPPFSLWSKLIPRDSPDFIPAMLADVRGYGFELIPEGAP
jgi:hypothetical protein